MKPESSVPVSADDPQNSDLYQAIGGSGMCRKLAVAFYAHVDHDPVLRPLYPPTLKGCPVDELATFFTQFFGGPLDYSPRRWSLSLREAHLRFAIGQREREAWLNDMFQAIDDVKIEDPARSALRWFFAQASAFLVNRSHEANESSLLSGNAVEYPKESETSPIHQEIARRWEAHLLLEEMIAAVRHRNADVALAVIENPVIQASFQRDRAAFLSFLTILSSSRQPDLLNYVRRTLVATPKLVQERYVYSRTLLHTLAGQGNIALVELLLQLGADPNAEDRQGHTPLYVVGNSENGANGAAVVRALVQAGADVNARERLKHCTALHMAARRGNVQIAKSLLDCGADIEARDKLGDTPLHRAVKCGKGEIAAFLISRGADVHAKGNKGLTPVQIARGAKMKQILQTIPE